MEVTVITPSIPERGELLAEAIASVNDQTHPPVAHLIGIDVAHAGPSVIRTRLVEAATTEWVAFLDDDDLLYPTHLERLAAHADDADIVIPYCRFIGKPIPAGYYNVRFQRATLAKHGIFPITVLARRSVILENGGFDPADRYEDWALWNRIADNGGRFVTVPERTWVYRTMRTDRRTLLPA